MAASTTQAALQPRELIQKYQRPAMPERTGWRVPREGRLWLIAAVGFWAIGWYKGINLVLLLAYLMVILWAANFWLTAQSLRGLRGRRRASGPVHVGEPAPWAVILTSDVPTRVPGGFFVEERMGGIVIGWFIGRWDPSAPLRLKQHLAFSLRGVYICEPLRVASRFPFGLVQRSIELAPPTEIVVLPRCGRLDRRLLSDWLVSATSGDGRRHVLHRITTLEADLHGLRPYRQGDSPRWIHWRTTARRGERMVREFELPDSPDLRVVLDPLLSDAEDASERLEAAVSLAATVCREWCREPGLRLGLTILGPDGGDEVHGLTGEELSRRLLEALARAVGRDADSKPSLNFDGRDGAPVLVITTDEESPIPDQVEAALRRPVGRVNANRPLPWYNPPKDNRPA